MTSWNPRFVEYARLVYGASPKKALRRDRRRYPGGRMAGFMAWISACWLEFLELNPDVDRTVLSESDHEAFDAWLAMR